MSSEIQDYNKWTRDFSNSFSSSSQRFLNFFPTFESMINEYFENYSLLPPHEKQTNDFLYRFVPEIASKIYRLYNIKDDALEFSVNQLLKILNLCVFLAEQSDFKLNKTMKLILNQNQNIYKYNNDLFTMLCQLFVSYDYYQRLVARCRECKPNIKNLSLVFSIREKLSKSVEIDLSEMLPILPDFINQFKGDSIRTIDSTKLNSIIQKNIVPAFPRKTNQPNPSPSIDFTPFFHFCELLIISVNLDKQLLGIKFLNNYLSNSAKDITSLYSWIKNSAESKQILDYLTQTSELHLEFIKLLDQLFIFLSSSHLINVDFINQMFITAKKMQKEESNAFYKLIIKSLNAMSNDEKSDKNLIKKFINDHKDSSEFLASFILDSNSQVDSANCISYLFENKALNEIKLIINNKTKKLIFDETIRIAESNQKSGQFDSEKVQIASEILSILINTSTALRSDFGQNSSEFISKIIFGFKFNNNLSFVYSILSSYYIKSKQAFEIEFLPELFECKSKANYDDFWEFMIKIMKANKRNSLKRDVVDSLYGIIENISNDYFPDSTPLFIEFFRYLIIIKCNFEYSLQLDRYDSLDEFRFRKLPPICMSLILKLYFLTKEHELMNSFMYQILTRQTNVPIRDEYKLFTTEFIPKLKDQKVDHVLKFYIVKLIYDVLFTIEKGIHLEDFGDIPKRRHCEITDDVIEMTLFMKTKDGKTTTVIRKIHASINDICADFLIRVRRILNDPKATASYNKISIYQPNMPLKNASISKNCQIEVNGTYKPLKESILSLLLTDSNTTLLDPLLQILRYVKTDKKEDLELAEITSKLLQFLPSYQNLNFDLSKCENYYVLIYYIQILAGFSQMDDEKIQELVNIFHSRKYKKTDFQIIQIFIRFFDKENLPKYLELLIDPLFECINGHSNNKSADNCYDIYNLKNNKNCKECEDLNHILLNISKCEETKGNELSHQAIRLLKKLTKHRKDPGSILAKKVNDMVSMSLRINAATVRKIFRIIDHLPDLTVFFPEFLKHVPIQSSNNELIFRFFFTLWSEMYEKRQIAKEPIGSLLFRKCIEWVDFCSIDRFKLCRIIRKTVKLLLKAGPDSPELDGDVIDYVDRFSHKLFENLFVRDNRNDLAPIFRFIEKVDKYDSKFNAGHRLKSIIGQCLLDLFSKVGRSNHYNMSANKYPKSLFTGLQNIGSTCFVNTIIQPLFYTYQFRYNVLFNTEKKSVMYDLFEKMLATQKGYVKMIDFLNQFEKDIEIHRQQDCLEFLLILSDKLDKDSYNLFKGVLVDHFISTVLTPDDKIATNDSRDEDFFHLSVNVQKFTNLEDSLKSLFGSSVVLSGLDNSANNSGGFDSNLQKYSRIKVAPQFLMICLNRFEYNLKTFQKIKINSKFSFPFVLDVTDFVEKSDNELNENEDVFSISGAGCYKYELYAVSLHNGSADSGHYTALVKISKKWVEFNDRSSRVITESDVKSLSFGTDNKKDAYSERNAYVLYYRRVTGQTSSTPVDLYDEEKIDQIFLRFSEGIEKVEHLSLFEDEKVDVFRDYSLSDMNSDRNVLASYFFNVFCHSSSRDAKEYVEKFIQKVDGIEKVDEGIQKGDTVYGFIVNNGYCPKLIETFLKCKIDQILVSIRSLLLNYSDNSKCKDVLTGLISSLSSFKERPEKIESITPLFLNYVTAKSTENQKSHSQIARESNWDKIILSFFDFCAKNLSEFEQKKVRLGDLLAVLKNLITTDLTAAETARIKDMSASIIDSIKKNLKLLVNNSFNSLPLLELFQSATNGSGSSQLMKMIEDNFRSDERNRLMMSFIIGLIECDSDAVLISDCLSIQKRKTDLSSFFKEYLRSSSGSYSCSLQQFLVDNYSQFVLPELLSSRKETRINAEHLTYDIFIEVKPPSNSPQYTNSRSTQNRHPTENLIQFSKGFGGNYFERIDQIITEMSSKSQNQRTIRNYEGYLFESFLRVFKWVVKRVNNCNDVKLEKSIINDDNHYFKVFDRLYNLFLFIDTNNSRSSRYTPDGNFRTILDVFTVFPYAVILAPKMYDEISQKIMYVVLSSLDFIPTSITVAEELSKILLLISTIKKGDKPELLLRIYESEKFLNFFKEKKNVRQNDTLFIKFYGSTISKVLEYSDIYRKESLIILDNPLNYSNDYSLLVELLSVAFGQLPGKFVIKVINWIVKCINDQKDPGYFMESVFSINSYNKNKEIILNNNNRVPFEELFVKSTSPLKNFASQPIPSTKMKSPQNTNANNDNNIEIDPNNEIFKSFDKIGYKSKLKYDDSTYYFSLIKYICKVSRMQVSSNPSLSYMLKLPDLILMKLLSKMSLIDGKNFTHFVFEISVYFDLAFEEQKFQFVSQFIEGIFPLADISNWFYYSKIGDTFLKFYPFVKSNEGKNLDNDIKAMFDSLLSVTKNCLLSINLNFSYSKNALAYTQSFLKESNDMIFKGLINNMVQYYNSINDRSKRGIVYDNLKKISYMFPSYAECIKSITKV